MAGVTYVTGTAVTATTNATTNTTFTATAACTGGKVIIGGGATITQGSNARAALTVSRATTTGANGVWTATEIIIDQGNTNPGPIVQASPSAPERPI